MNMRGVCTGRKGVERYGEYVIGKGRGSDGKNGLRNRKGRESSGWIGEGSI